MMSSTRKPFPLLLFSLLLLLLPLLAKGQDAETEEPVAGEVEPAYAVLYPWFILAVGIVTYYVLSRYATWMPYTAVMFLIGTIIGVCTRNINNEPNQLNISIEEWWMEIDSEVLLLCFLPGLVFSDSTGLNTHLFEKGFWQVILFAFPLVLGGTALTALVAFYIFPYGWSFNLAMTFGSILSATDPVAVAALLEQVGAPPRLKTHIAGESLLNDGSAMVFFTIFSQLYLLELGVPGLGKDINGAQGVGVFCRMAFGGMAVGMFFAILMLSILHTLKWRLKRDENVTEVAASITMAYLCYYTADSAWGTSGVIAVVTLGVISQALGKGLINDQKLYDDFWSMVEWFLNTILFALGGLVWGAIIANNDPDFPELIFTGTDWGYVFVNYILLTVIRYILFISAYPISSRIGLGSSLQEMFFQAFGGLRGAVGISLSIYLENLVRSLTLAGAVDSTKYVAETHKLFGHIGGIAFLTLMINATTAGPVLIKLGLADVTDVRKRMLTCYESHLRHHVIYDFVRILGMEQPSKGGMRYNFGIIQHHLPGLLGNMTREELMAAVERYVHNNPDENHDIMYNQIKRILPSLKKKDDKGDDEEKGTKEEDTALSGDDDAQDVTKMMATDEVSKTFTTVAPNKRDLLKTTNTKLLRSSLAAFTENMTLIELRRVFLELVRGRYAAQNKMGEVLDREFVYFSLTQSLDIAVDHITKGPLDDWEHVDIVEQTWLDKAKALKYKIKGILPFCSYIMGESMDPELLLKRINIEQCVFFIRAHSAAQHYVKEHFKETEFAPIVEELLAESEAEVEKAREKLATYDAPVVEVVMSHKIARILLNNCASYVEELTESGLLKEQEATGYLEKIQDVWNQVELCDMANHPGEMVPNQAPDPEDTSGDDVAKSKSLGTGSSPPE